MSLGSTRAGYHQRMRNAVGVPVPVFWPPHEPLDVAWPFDETLVDADDESLFDGDTVVDLFLPSYVELADEMTDEDWAVTFDEPLSLEPAISAAA